MSDARTEALEIQYKQQRAYTINPFATYPIFLRPYRLKILMVTDGGGRFARADFGLSALLDALSVAPGPWEQFVVTKAHRGFDAGADLQGFRFDTTDLGDYDQIWMFAVQRSGNEISTAELSAISQFMDAGGGVFATGDHEDLGVSMCGSIPRVRSMRKWHWPNPGPNGEPVAPRVDGVNRFDTLRAGGDPGVEFDDQSDDVPQVIVPRLYSTSPWSHYFHRARPHPLLCGPRGIINRMPDHPHEGECYEPADLSASFTFNGYTITEYPSGVAPQVIATSRVFGGRAAADVKGVLNPRTFGSIGAYDGHQADVGRVVVDSTWHHFFDVNLIGELGNPSPAKSAGFNYSVLGHEAFEDIKSYYRNIAVWIASEPAQQAMWFRALWWTRWHHRLVMDVRPAYLTGEARLDLGELIRIGSEGRDALGRVASQCTTLRWVIQYVIRPQFPKIWKELQPLLDPWRPRPPLPDPPPEWFEEAVPDPATGIHMEILTDAVFGAAIYAVAARYPVGDDESRERAEKGDLADVIAEQVHQAIDEVAAYAARHGRATVSMAKLLNRG